MWFIQRLFPPSHPSMEVLRGGQVSTTFCYLVFIVVRSFTGDSFGIRIF